MSERTVVEVATSRESLFSREFVILLIVQSAFGMGFSALFLLPKYMKVALHQPDELVGVLQAMSALASVFAFPLVGMLNDRYGRKPFAALGALLMTLTCAGMLWYQSAGPLLYVLRALQGVAFALLFNSASTLAADSVSLPLLGRALAVQGASMLATNALAPAVTEPVAARWGWSAMFWLSLGFSLLSFVLSFLLRERRAQRHVDAKGASTLHLLTTPRGLCIAFLMAATGAGFGAVFTFHQPYAVSLGIQRVSGFFVFYAIFALTMRLFLMERVDRWGRQRASALFVFLYASGVLLTAWLRPGMLEVVGAVMGLAHGVFYPLFNALAVERCAPQERGSMMALYHGSFNAGMSALLLAGGSVARHFGYPVLFGASAAVTALGAVVLLRTRVFGPDAKA